MMPNRSANNPREISDIIARGLTSVESEARRHRLLLILTGDEQSRLCELLRCLGDEGRLAASMAAGPMADELESLRSALLTMESELAHARDRTLPESPTSAVVMFMAQRMERKLEMNRHKGAREGWLSDSPESLSARVREEWEELHAAIEDGDASPDEIWSEAADVANMAMMAADSCDRTFFETAESGGV